MGDRYELKLACAWCGFKQEVYYAESSGFTDFTCEKCGKKNGIDLGFTSWKIEN